jgi:hypothetical protein
LFTYLTPTLLPFSETYSISLLTMAKLTFAKGASPFQMTHVTVVDADQLKANRSAALGSGARRR